jgi:D-aspartate ligase
VPLALRRTTTPATSFRDSDDCNDDRVNGAVVIGGDSRGLGIARSLGRRGIPVWVVCEGDYLVAGRSRYATRRLDWPGERDGVAYLLALAEDEGADGWTLYATSDETSALVARNHAALAERFQLTTPDWSAFRWAYDKRLTNELADSVGVAHPWTLHPASRHELETAELSFPLILKPALKQELNRFTYDKAWPVRTRAELLRRYDEACSLVPSDQVMLQQLIAGSGESQYSFGAACVDGRPIAWVTARRTRQYPVDFGHSSSFVETLENEAVERDARRLLGEMGYSGLVEVEFKRDPDTGEYGVLDINPRLWTWHTIGRKAGVDFPYLAWLVGQGEPPPETAGRPDVRWMRVATDVLSAAAMMRAGGLSLRGYLRSFRRPLELAVFARDDPRPALAAAPQLVSRMFRRLPVLFMGSARRAVRLAGRGSSPR